MQTKGKAPAARGASSARRFGENERLRIVDRAETLWGTHTDPKTGKEVPHNEHGEDREQIVNLRGEPVTVASQPYYSETKQDYVYPVRLSDEAGGALVGVPSRRLARDTVRRRVFAGLGHAWDRIFGNG